MRNKILVSGLLIMGLLGTGCAQEMVQEAQSPQIFTGDKADDYRIGADDKLQITVWRNPELSTTVPVRPDGKISIPLVGDVMAGGNTPEQVAAIIKQQLTAYIREPNVAVMVVELRSHEFISRVRVTGAVRTPRSMPYRQGMTVLDAVLEAGGPNEFAAPNRAKLYRKGKEKTEVIDIDLGDILNKGKLNTNYSLRPADVVTVPERLF
jgi:polysaccharide export outer membrane protein